MRDGSAKAHLYRPKLATVLAEGYNFGSFCRDMIAALTVAIVAVPLSMAIAVASGVSPQLGLYAAVTRPAPGGQLIGSPPRRPINVSTLMQSSRTESLLPVNRD
jgi:hypothetical protein